MYNTIPPEYEQEPVGWLTRLLIIIAFPLLLMGGIAGGMLLILVQKLMKLDDG